MSSHKPILSTEAIELIKARNLDDAGSLLADFAAAGLVKTYALLREIKPIDGSAKIVRDAYIPSEEWNRIIASEELDTALRGGTVRLEGSQLRGGAPSVHITGISFSKRSLNKVLDRYCTAPQVRSEADPLESDALKGEVASPSCQDQQLAKKSAPPIKAGDLTATIAQAERATTLSRTKINELMREGVLVRKKVGSRTLITVESIDRLLGVKFT